MHAIHKVVLNPTSCWLLGLGALVWWTHVYLETRAVKVLAIYTVYAYLRLLFGMWEKEYMQDLRDIVSSQSFFFFF